MMNFLTKLSGMNVMMAEDVNMPALRSARSHEVVRTKAETRKTDGLWNENFERMFRRR